LKNITNLKAPRCRLYDNTFKNTYRRHTGTKRADQDLALVHKFVTKKDGQTLFNQQSGARTRQAAGGHGLTVQYARTDPRKHSFAVRTVEPWNRLPESVRAAETGESFKRRLRGTT
jgi:hypothetical protein